MWSPPLLRGLGHLAQVPLKPKEKNVGGTLVGRKWDACIVGSGQRSAMWRAMRSTLEIIPQIVLENKHGFRNTVFIPGGVRGHLDKRAMKE